MAYEATASWEGVFESADVMRLVFEHILKRCSADAVIAVIKCNHALHRAHSAWWMARRAQAISRLRKAARRAACFRRSTLEAMYWWLQRICTPLPSRHAWSHALHDTTRCLEDMESSWFCFLPTGARPLMAPQLYRLHDRTGHRSLTPAALVHAPSAHAHDMQWFAGSEMAPRGTLTWAVACAIALWEYFAFFDLEGADEEEERTMVVAQKAAEDLADVEIARYDHGPLHAIVAKRRRLAARLAPHLANISLAMGRLTQAPRRWLPERRGWFAIIGGDGFGLFVRLVRVLLCARRTVIVRAVFNTNLRWE